MAAVSVCGHGLAQGRDTTLVVASYIAPERGKLFKHIDKIVLQKILRIIFHYESHDFPWGQKQIQISCEATYPMFSRTLTMSIIYALMLILMKRGSDSRDQSKYLLIQQKPDVKFATFEALRGGTRCNSGATRLSPYYRS